MNTVVDQARLPFTLPTAVLGATLLTPLLTSAGSSQAPLHIVTRCRGHTAAAAASPLDHHDREDDDNEQRAAAPDGDTDDGPGGEHRGAVRGGRGRDGRAARLCMEEA